MGYDVYFDKVRIPVPPSKIGLKINGKIYIDMEVIEQGVK